MKEAKEEKRPEFQIIINYFLLKVQVSRPKVDLLESLHRR